MDELHHRLLAVAHDDDLLARDSWPLSGARRAASALWSPPSPDCKRMRMFKTRSCGAALGMASAPEHLTGGFGERARRIAGANQVAAAKASQNCAPEVGGGRPLFASHPAMDPSRVLATWFALVTKLSGREYLGRICHQFDTVFRQNAPLHLPCQEFISVGPESRASQTQFGRYQLPMQRAMTKLHGVHEYHRVF